MPVLQAGAAVGLADRVHAPAVVAEVELAVGQREPALDGAGRLVTSSARRRRPRAARRPCRSRSRRRCGRCRRPARTRCARAAGASTAACRRSARSAATAPGVPLPRSRIVDEHAPVAVGGRGGGQPAELALPHELAGALVEDVQRGVVLEQEQLALGHDRRELEQDLARIAPDAPERRPQARRRRQVLALVLGVAVARPEEVLQRVLARRALLGLLRDLLGDSGHRRLGHELDVRVRDVAGRARSREDGTRRQEHGEHHGGALEQLLPGRHRVRSRVATAPVALPSSRGAA